MIDRRKFFILDNFAFRVRNLELELGRSCNLWIYREHGWARIRGRNSNTQLFMSFGNKLIYLILWKNVKFEKWFLKWKWFYKTKMENLILNCFLNDWNFIKIILKLGFADWHVWQKKLRQYLYVSFWNDLQDIIIAWWITRITILDYDVVATRLSWSTGG